MRSFFVKVCGITRPRDAELACRLGVSFLGLVFHPASPRFVSRSQAREVTRAVYPTVESIGVFVDTPLAEMLALADALDLRYVQLHRRVSALEQKQIAREGLKLIQAFHLRSANDLPAIRSCTAPLVLLDNRTERLAGGTGVPFDWKLRPRPSLHNLVLSGGIGVENLAKAVSLVRPLVVDVNSRVESAPGVKSPAKLRQFFAKVDELRHGT